jgi:hypothetical protein
VWASSALSRVRAAALERRFDLEAGLRRGAGPPGSTSLRSVIPARQKDRRDSRRLAVPVEDAPGAPRRIHSSDGNQPKTSRAPEKISPLSFMVARARNHRNRLASPSRSASSESPSPSHLVPEPFH